MTGTTTPGELTVTPVYWTPTGFTLPVAYKNLVNRFIADIAADSGKRTNVFSSLTEFTKSGGTHLSYKVHAGTPIIDTTAFPANGCTPDTGLIYNDNSGYTKCITNAQLLTEANNFTTAKGLPKNDLAHLYMYFLPKHVETCFTSTNGASGGSCSININGGFCGYHAFASPPLVANMNFAVVDSPLGWTCSSDGGSNTGGNQSPNSNIEADTELSITSHEIIETITDPQGTAWFDSAGFENGDECAYVFGDSTSFIGTGLTKHNQVINGHFYFIQQEPSNHAFSVDSQWTCEQRNQALVASTTPANNATNVFPNTAVVAVFDIAMNHAATQAAFTLKRTSNGASVAGAFSWYGNALIFKPNADLLGGVQYTANITTAARRHPRRPVAGREDVEVHGHQPPGHRTGQSGQQRDRRREKHPGLGEVQQGDEHGGDTSRLHAEAHQQRHRRRRHVHVVRQRADLQTDHEPAREHEVHGQRQCGSQGPGEQHAAQSNDLELHHRSQLTRSRLFTDPESVGR